jgi:hypothetical protein
MGLGSGWFGLEGWVRFSVRVGFSDTRVDFLLVVGLVGLVWLGWVWFGLVRWFGLVWFVGLEGIRGIGEEG